MLRFPMLAAMARQRRIGTFGGTSAAAAFLASYGPYGMVMDFTDDASIAINDEANTLDYSSVGTVSSSGALLGPGSKLTNTAPSLKLTEQADGFLSFQAHNLYANSAAPANQSVTTGMVTGGTYAITLTGSVSITLSGAATGTVTAGTTTFTAASGTLTCGSTSGSGTVHLRRTPSVSTYVATPTVLGATTGFDLPYVYSAGVKTGILVEPAATNLCLRSNDFTNASWTKSNMTTALTATGPDGVANSASTLTATAGNATALQAITSASSSRLTHCYIKRRTGSGNIDLTQDNGTTWATQTVTSAWTRVALAAVTSTNPTVGIRIVTSGDAVDVAYFQHETGTVATSPIITYGSSVVRAVDNIYIPTTLFPNSETLSTLFCDVVWQDSLSLSTYAVTLDDGGGSAFLTMARLGTNITWRKVGGTGATINLTCQASAALNTRYKLAGSYAVNRMRAASNGVAVAEDTTAQAKAVATRLQIGSYSGAAAGNMRGLIKTIAYLPAEKTNAELAGMTA